MHALIKFVSFLFGNNNNTQEFSLLSWIAFACLRFSTQHIYLACMLGSQNLVVNLDLRVTPDGRLEHAFYRQNAFGGQERHV